MDKPYITGISTEQIRAPSIYLGNNKNARTFEWILQMTTISINLLCRKVK